MTPMTASARGEKAVPITDFFESLDLAGLYKAQRLSSYAVDRIGSAVTEADKTRMDTVLEDLHRTLEELHGLLDHNGELFDTDTMMCQIRTGREEYIRRTAGAEESEQDRKKSRGKMISRIAGVPRLTEMERAVLHCIRADKTDRLAKAGLYLRYGTLPERAKDDVEALLYLRSRDLACREQQAGLVDGWETFIAKHPWNSGHEVIRVAEHCHVPDIEQWWEKWFDRFDQRVDRRSMDKIKAALILFDLCRSKHAVKILADDHTKLWNHTNSFFNELYFDPTDQREGSSPIVIAATLFAAQMTACQFVSAEMLEESLKMLLQQQSRDGGWAHSQRMRNKLSVLSTAVAIHALAALKPSGWHEIAKRAVAWLKKVQNGYGFWSDIHFRNHVYLTVLVLDAINMAEDRVDELTFQLGTPPDRHLSIDELTSKDLETGLPFKEKRRGRGRGRRYSDRMLERVEALYHQYCESCSKAEAWHRAAKECKFESGDAAKMQVRRYGKNRTP